MAANREEAAARCEEVVEVGSTRLSGDRVTVWKRVLVVTVDTARQGMSSEGRVAGGLLQRRPQLIWKMRDGRVWKAVSGSCWECPEGFQLVGRRERGDIAALVLFFCLVFCSPGGRERIV